MNKIFAAVFTVFAMMGSVWADINRECPQFTAYGAPQAQWSATTQQLCKKNYAVIHSCSVKNPVAVMEHVSAEDVNGPAKRRNDFREDPAVRPECRSTMADYAGSGYDRGHLVPAANNTQSADIMSESFFLSNMIPQVPGNNRGIWRILELQVRDSVRTTGQDLYVISGAVYAQGSKTIGNGVAVPTQVFKIIINKRTGNVTAFLMPNENLPVADLPKYRTTLEAVEQAAGMRFPVQ
jgi:endonuclease G